jgi:hypothetical protein
MVAGARYGRSESTLHPRPVRGEPSNSTTWQRPAVLDFRRSGFGRSGFEKHGFESPTGSARAWRFVIEDFVEIAR